MFKIIEEFFDAPICPMFEEDIEVRTIAIVDDENEAKKMVSELNNTKQSFKLCYYYQQV